MIRDTFEFEKLIRKKNDAGFGVFLADPTGRWRDAEFLGSVQYAKNREDIATLLWAFLSDVEFREKSLAAFSGYTPAPWTLFIDSPEYIRRDEKLSVLFLRVEPLFFRHELKFSLYVYDPRPISDEIRDGFAKNGFARYL